MSNPNPFVPKGSLLEQQSKRRSNLKIGVSIVLAVSIVGLLAMLIQGCKRDTSSENSPTTDQDTNVPAIQPDTNAPTMVDTNAPIVTAPVLTNTPPPPMMTQPVIAAPAENPPPAETEGSEYVVVSGDTLGKIAKKNGVTLKALEAANPGVNAKHLKVKQKLTIPAGGSTPGGITASASADTTGADTGTATGYTVKSGDTLHKIAKRFGTSVKAIEAENNLSTTKIKVGQKLKIPGKAETAAPEAMPAPAAPAPAMPAPPSTPAAPGAGSATGAPGAT
ncbi:MAG TPA: LysM peptidoglycan-binding domain-containing protein [Candidatus Angelobacter sp.]|nr:LysM peptidoglycan-binding domain-containing protein [Candidatus Angelobacter sp.]